MICAKALLIGFILPLTPIDTWYKDKEGRIYRQKMYNKKRYSEFLHRRILNAPKHLVVDHIDGDVTNNKRSNLRLCTQQQNTYNQGPKSGRFKGVYFKKDRNKFRAEIRIKGKKTHLGYFTCEIEAARTYNKASRLYHRQYGYINDLA